MLATFPQTSFSTESQYVFSTFQLAARYLFARDKIMVSSRMQVHHFVFGQYPLIFAIGYLLNFENELGKFRYKIN
jgi:hypothetical protein